MGWGGCVLGGGGGGFGEVKGVWGGEVRVLFVMIEYGVEWDDYDEKRRFMGLWE
jgi:hypothetical protein